MSAVIDLPFNPSCTAYLCDAVQAVPYVLDVPTGNVTLKSGVLLDAFNGGIAYLLQQYTVDGGLLTLLVLAANTSLLLLLPPPPLLLLQTFCLTFVSERGSLSRRVLTVTAGTAQ